MTTELKKYKRIFYRLSLHLKLYIHKFQREKDLFITLSIVQPEKRLPKILGDLFRVKNLLKMAIIPFFRCSKTLGESGKQEIYNKCSENSRYQIVFRKDIFQKLSLGAPEPETCFLIIIKNLPYTTSDCLL